MDLRERLAKALQDEIIWFHPDLVGADAWLGAADAILQIPEIAEALEARRINAMSPSQFGAMLLDQLPDASAKEI